MTVEILLTKPRPISCVIERRNHYICESIYYVHGVRIYKPNLKANILADYLLLGLMIWSMKRNGEPWNHILHHALNASRPLCVYLLIAGEVDIDIFVCVLVLKPGVGALLNDF